MSYYYTNQTKGDFNSVLEEVIQLLKEEGFGVLTKIDMQQTVKEKLDKQIHKYTILGACNPPFAYQALLAENKIGTMLPCNIIIQELPSKSIEVSAINPSSSMDVIDNKELKKIANTVSQKLENVIKRIGNER